MFTFSGFTEYRSKQVFLAQNSGTISIAHYNQEICVVIIESLRKVYL